MNTRRIGKSNIVYCVLGSASPDGWTTILAVVLVVVVVVVVIIIVVVVVLTRRRLRSSRFYTYLCLHLIPNFINFLCN